MRVEIKGFKVHIEKEVDFEESKMTLIKGASGNGKTTILQAIYWALYGNMTGIYNDLGITKDLSVTLTFGNIRVFRKKKPDLLKVTLYESDGAKEYKDLVAQSVIDNMFGTKEVWKSCSYISQKKICSFLEGTAKESMAILNALSFSGENPRESIDKITSKCKEVQSAFEKGQAVFSSEVESFTKELQARPTSKTLKVEMEGDILKKIKELEGELETLALKKKEKDETLMKIDFLKGLVGKALIKTSEDRKKWEAESKVPFKEYKEPTKPLFRIPVPLKPVPSFPLPIPALPELPPSPELSLSPDLPDSPEQEEEEEEQEDQEEIVEEYIEDKSEEENDEESEGKENDEESEEEGGKEETVPESLVRETPKPKTDEKEKISPIQFLTKEREIQEAEKEKEELEKEILRVEELRFQIDEERERVLESFGGELDGKTIWETEALWKKREANIAKCEELGVEYSEGALQETIASYKKQLNTLSFLEGLIPTCDKLSDLKVEIQNNSTSHTSGELEGMIFQKSLLIAEMKKGLDLLSCPSCKGSLRYKAGTLISEGEILPTKKEDLLKEEEEKERLHKLLETRKVFEEKARKVEELEREIQSAIQKEGVSLSKLEEFVRNREEYKGLINDTRVYIEALQTVELVPSPLWTAHFLQEVMEYSLKKKEYQMEKAKGELLKRRFHVLQSRDWKGEWGDLKKLQVLEEERKLKNKELLDLWLGMEKDRKEKLEAFRATIEQKRKEREEKRKEREEKRKEKQREKDMKRKEREERRRLFEEKRKEREREREEKRKEKERKRREREARRKEKERKKEEKRREKERKRKEWERERERKRREREEKRKEWEAKNQEREKKIQEREGIILSNLEIEAKNRSIEEENGRNMERWRIEDMERRAIWEREKANYELSKQKAREAIEQEERETETKVKEIEQLEGALDRKLESRILRVQTGKKNEEKALEEIAYTKVMVEKEKVLTSKREGVVSIYNDLVALESLKEAAINTECKQLEDTVSNINLTLQRTLALFFPDPISVEFLLYKQLKKRGGGVKPGLNIHITYKGKEKKLDNLSGGELVRVSLSVLLALNFVSASPFLFLDEAITGLDPDLKENCLEGIRSVPNKTIICIDHDESMEGYYDNIVEV